MVFVRANYRKMQMSPFCPLCLSGVANVFDTQEHLIICEKLAMNFKDVIESDAPYNNLFSDNQQKQARISLILESRYRMRVKLQDI